MSELTFVRRAKRRDRDALGYEPALDGLRAVAVTAVLLFHARFSWIPGGFLGVSSFFTLSGFLITSLMLKEWRATSALDVRGFFSRRFRRLLPASWVTMGLVVAMGALGVWTTSQLRDLRGDIPWALAELVNWHFIAAGRSYGAQFAAPSPLEHYWSLAVEQQFYLVLPAVVIAVLALARRRGSRHGVAALAGVLATMMLVSLVLNWWFARESIPRAYFGTDTRLAELAAGALLACVGLGRIRGGTHRRRVLLELAGLVGLAGSVVLWATAAVTSPWLYPWGLLATSAASVTLVVAALQRGVAARVLSLAPIVALGRISYGVYLLHWPVFLWLSPARVGWAPWPLFGLRMAVTIAAAVLMFRLIEVPVRRGVRLRGRVAPRVAVPAAAVLLVSAFVVTSDLPAPSSLEVAAATTVPAPPPAPIRVLVIGDELAASWQLARGTLDVPLEVQVASAPSCGLALGGWVRMSDGNVERDTDRCGSVKDTWVAAVAEQRPDVVIVASALRDVADRRVDLDAAWEAPGSPGLDDFLGTEVRELLDRLAPSGAALVVATSPHLANAAAAPAPPTPILPADQTRSSLVAAQGAEARDGVPPPGWAENDAPRIDRWNQLLTEAATARGAGVIDLASIAAGWPAGEFDPERRAVDGVGFTEIGMAEIGEAVAPQLEAARPATPAADPAAEVAANAPLPEPPPPAPRRTIDQGQVADVLVVGDSVAFNVGTGLVERSRSEGTMRVQSAGQLGCPIARGGQFRFLRDIDTFEARCDWAAMFPRFLDERDPEVVVLTSGIWEVVDRRLPGDDRFRHIGQPEIDRYLLRELLTTVDLLGSQGASVVLLTYPHFEAGRDQGYVDLPESDPARVDRLNEIMREVASLRPGVVTVVEFQAWLAARPGGELDPAIREDGLHFYDSFAPTIAEWLAPQLVDLARTGAAPPAGA
jgi:peptidoglycan/LPS O-acetylase OafA/YrhL/lysophospholipase L1-like esterase